MIYIIRDSVELFNLSAKDITRLKQNVGATALVFWFGLFVEFASCFAEKDLFDTQPVIIAQIVITSLVCVFIVLRSDIFLNHFKT
jgi:hypothetical protein